MWHRRLDNNSSTTDLRGLKLEVAGLRLDDGGLVGSPGFGAVDAVLAAESAAPRVADRCVSLDTHIGHRSGGGGATGRPVTLGSERHGIDVGLVSPRPGGHASRLVGSARRHVLVLATSAASRRAVPVAISFDP